MVKRNQLKYIEEQNENEELKKYLSPNACDQWVQFGWLSKSDVKDYCGKIWYTPNRRVLLFSILLTNCFVCFYFGPESDASVRYNYDIWAQFPKPIWIYVRTLIVITCLTAMSARFWQPEFENKTNFIFRTLKGEFSFSVCF